ncbi:MAG: hypothetical protein LUO88_03080 [Methanoregulaceae archaeon]|nr:hypothetical protein [Methanoregulaceae archaeon]
MKWIAFVILIIGIVLVAGCTSPSQPVTTPATITATPATTPSATATATTVAPALPNLLGTWNGTSVGFSWTGSEYQAYNDTLVVKVTGQDGYLFTGVLSFPEANGTQVTKEFAGALDADAKGIALIEYPGGFTNGVILSADAIEMVFRDQAAPSTIAVDALRRSAPAPAMAVPPAMPDLLGIWNGTSVGSSWTGSEYQVSTLPLTMKVTGQNGRLFSGEISYQGANGTEVVKEFAGALSPDGKEIATIEYPDGFCDGTIVSADEIELVFLDETNPSMVTIDTFWRTKAPSSVAANPMANLVGNWTGTSIGYMRNASGYERIYGVLTMKVIGQDDRSFTGQVAYVVDGTPVTKDFAGVIARDGQTIATVEYPGGFGDGTIISADEIRLIFRDEAEPSTISVDSFRRTK